ncbi:MAG: hypothetical protein QXW97_03050 [Candidatus Pacearchaeota archaeon]
MENFNLKSFKEFNKNSLEVNEKHRKINLKIYGGGKFAQEILRALKRENWAYVDLYSSSASESIGKKPENGDFSYKAIERVLDLEEMKNQNRFNTHNSLDSFLEKIEETEFIFFASGPHINYSNSGTIRGRGSENFYHILFTKTLTKLEKFCKELKNRRYNGNLWILSNPVGPLCLAAKEFEATQYDKIGSPTVDGFRAAKLIAKILNNNPEVREKIGSITYKNIEKIPILGEHHTPIYLFESITIKNSKGNLYKLYNVFPKAKKRFFQDRFKRELKDIAIETMISSDKLKTGYSEAPETIVRVLKSIAYNLPLQNFESAYIWNSDFNAYLMDVVKYNLQKKKYELEDNKPKFNNKIKKRLKSQAEAQRNLVYSTLQVHKI